uniref:Uncharacterized protein n=1 Tax=Chromera velia CCMP2878 TaxID=1169474 RepID=A0A0G4F5W4_9ALVE|eukprot:Cvel_2748.t1-p1 / transcript=Cvel_2748.t1 / gene=Cvel_2748 / organism=Chromera_velia_CCMP2878 / gene_product=hypothetical protein / transcript_product=hypothetical protein / location=Cvel_scaffold110:65709-71993(+) / protein_length=154 / sequence_SO=supercontig / SO=protein_coding / is_pseudo=false
MRREGCMTPRWLERNGKGMVLGAHSARSRAFLVRVVAPERRPALFESIEFLGKVPKRGIDGNGICIIVHSQEGMEVIHFFLASNGHFYARKTSEEALTASLMDIVGALRVGGGATPSSGVGDTGDEASGGVREGEPRAGGKGPMELSTGSMERV